MVNPQDSKTTASPHVASLWELWGVFLALTGLTVLTVTASQLSIGDWDIVVALGIAGVKAALVATCFMHLRHDKGFNIVLLLGAIAFLALFLAVTMIDIVQLG